MISGEGFCSSGSCQHQWQNLLWTQARPQVSQVNPMQTITNIASFVVPACDYSLAGQPPCKCRSNSLSGKHIFPPTGWQRGYVCGRYDVISPRGINHSDLVRSLAQEMIKYSHEFILQTQKSMLRDGRRDGRAKELGQRAGEHA